MFVYLLLFFGIMFFVFELKWHFIRFTWQLSASFFFSAVTTMSNIFTFSTVWTNTHNSLSHVMFVSLQMKMLQWSIHDDDVALLVLSKDARQPSRCMNLCISLTNPSHLLCIHKALGIIISYVYIHMYMCVCSYVVVDILTYIWIIGSCKYVIARYTSDR